MSNDEAGQAREGLFDSVAGKAKEVAGAVSGRDDMVAEGQLQQAEARNLKAAAADDAVAKADEAAHEVRDTSGEAAMQKDEARAQTDHEESILEQQRKSEHAVATLNAELQEAVGREAAEWRADELAESRLQDAEAIAADATSTEQQSAAENLRLAHETAAAAHEAAEQRAQTED